MYKLLLCQIALKTICAEDNKINKIFERHEFETKLITRCCLSDNKNIQLLIFKDITKILAIIKLKIIFTAQYFNGMVFNATFNNSTIFQSYRGGQFNW